MQRVIVLGLVTFLAFLTGCDRARDFRSAVPQKGTVEMRVPQSGGQALTEGEIAPLYEASVGIAVSVNLGVLWAFDVVEFIIAHPPTSIDENVAVWGPSEPEGLERLSYMFTVEKVAEGEYIYRLEARPKDEDGDFTVIFEGAAQPNEDNDGTGTLTYHLGSLRQLNDRDACLTGDIDVAYDAASEPRLLDVVFTQVADECAGERPTSAHYTYQEAEDASGQMDFAFQANIHAADEAKDLEEIMSVRTRWLSNGAGRSDVRVSEGEIPADLALYIPGTSSSSVDMVECWDDSFALVHADTSPDELEPHLDHPNTGDAALCSHADASHAEL